MNLLISAFWPLFLCFRVGGSFRSGVPEMNLLIPAFWPLFPAFRGWIVPVGGSTPDRLKIDRLRIDRLSQSAQLTGARAQGRKGGLGAGERGRE